MCARWKSLEGATERSERGRGISAGNRSRGGRYCMHREAVLRRIAGRKSVSMQGMDAGKEVAQSRCKIKFGGEAVFRFAESAKFVAVRPAIPWACSPCGGTVRKHLPGAICGRALQGLSKLRKEARAAKSTRFCGNLQNQSGGMRGGFAMFSGGRGLCRRKYLLCTICGRNGQKMQINRDGSGGSHKAGAFCDFALGGAAGGSNQRFRHDA